MTDASELPLDVRDGRRRRSHPEGRLHLGLEDVALEVVGQDGWRSRGVQGLLRQLLLLALPEEWERRWTEHGSDDL